MVKGKIRAGYGELTARTILERINSYDIYRHYLNIRFDLGEAFCNPYRRDLHPSMSVKFVCGDLHHFDYGDDYWRGRCFDLVMQINRCSYNEALEIVNRDFGLCLRDSAPLQEKSRIITWDTPKELKSEPPPLITFSYHTSFSSRQLNYWSKLGVAEEEMKKDNIYNPKNIYINHKRVRLPDDLCFIYHYPGDTRMFKGGSVAIYRPEAEKKKKWFKNVTFTHVEHVDKLEGCDRGYLTKSRKDCLLLRNVLQTDCIATIQAEHMSALSPEALEALLKCDQRYAIMDSDETGKSLSWHLTKEYKFSHINSPDCYLQEGLTDFSDVAMKYGIDTVRNYFKTKQLI